MADATDLQARREAHIAEHHRLDLKRTALLVIDMQCGFVREGASLEVPLGRGIIGNIAQLIDACREQTIPVVFTEFVYAETIPCLRGDPFGREHLPLQSGSPAYGRPSGNCLIGPNAGLGAESAATIDELAPRADELVIQAHAYDKFHGTPLDMALRARDIRHLIITGLTTDVCVNHTLMSATTREYRVTAVTDGVATIDPAIQDACFAIWRNKFAHLQTTAELLPVLRGY
jgi:nicotinamidase-related amidase